MNNKISHEDLTTSINEEKTTVSSKESLQWWELTEVVLEKNYLIEEYKKKHWWNYLTKCTSIKKFHNVV